MDPIILLIIGITLLLVIGVVIFVFTRGGGSGSDDKSTRDRLDRFVTDMDGDGKKKKKKTSDEKSPSKLTQNIDEAIENKGFTRGIRVKLAQANLKITPTEYIMLIIISMVVTAALAFILFHRSLPLALGGAVLGFFLPRFYLGMRKSKRLKEFDGQLGDTITLIANGLRSGYSILQAMESVGEEMPPPISEEFRRVVREVQLGVSNERAMNNMVQRIPSEDLDLMITAINVQHEVGGNLAEILEIIGFVIRERVRIQGEIKTLTAQGMISGYVLSFMPIILGLLLFAMNPEYMGRMILACTPDMPAAKCTQPCGWIMIGVGLFLIFLGFTAIMKIVKIEV
ncbi:MAG TPA: secretion system protein F [Chloroflexi bacterium]|nr:secretion system protein F [Chloroflexota bacterium]